eukprot:m.856867 g.856867  ORF g.856867 m.856867 type:complete len:1639 (-) comp59640_c0_seq8:47-4963(-)
MVRWSALTLLCLAIVISTHSSVMASDECWTALTPSYTFDPFEFSLPTGTLTVTPELFRPFSPPFSRSLAGIKLAVSTIARDLITFKINLFQEDPFDLAARGEFVVSLEGKTSSLERNVSTGVARGWATLRPNAGLPEVFLESSITYRMYLEDVRFRNGSSAITALQILTVSEEYLPEGHPSDPEHAELYLDVFTNCDPIPIYHFDPIQVPAQPHYSSSMQLLRLDHLADFAFAEFPYQGISEAPEVGVFKLVWETRTLDLELANSTALLSLAGTSFGMAFAGYTNLESGNCFVEYGILQGPCDFVITFSLEVLPEILCPSSHLETAPPPFAFTHFWDEPSVPSDYPSMASNFASGDQFFTGATSVQYFLLNIPAHQAYESSIVCSFEVIAPSTILINAVELSTSFWSSSRTLLIDESKIHEATTSSLLLAGYSPHGVAVQFTSSNGLFFVSLASQTGSLMFDLEWCQQGQSFNRSATDNIMADVSVRLTNVQTKDQSQGVLQGFMTDDIGVRVPLTHGMAQFSADKSCVSLKGETAGILQNFQMDGIVFSIFTSPKHNSATPTVFDDPSPKWYYASGTSSLEFVAEAIPDELGFNVFKTMDIEDIISPDIKCPGTVYVLAPPGESSVEVQYEIYTSDNLDSNPMLKTTIPSGSRFAVNPAAKKVTATVTDFSGNSESCSFYVSVSFVPNTVEVGLRIPSRSKFSAVVSAQRPDATSTYLLDGSTDAAQYSIQLAFTPETTQVRFRFFDDVNSYWLLPPPFRPSFRGRIYQLEVDLLWKAVRPSRVSTWRPNDYITSNVTLAANSTHAANGMKTFAAVDEFGWNSDSATMIDPGHSIRVRGFGFVLSDLEFFEMLIDLNMPSGLGVNATTAAVTYQLQPSSYIRFTEHVHRVRGVPYIRFFDNVPPVLTCSPGIAFNSSSRAPNFGDFTAAYRPSATDNRDIPFVECRRSDDGGFEDPFPVGTTNVTCTASDYFENSADCSFLVQVTDDTVPILHCPSNVTATLGDENSTVTVNIEDIYPYLVSDNDPASITAHSSPSPQKEETPTEFEFGADGLYAITFSFQDNSENTAECTTFVQVLDKTPPVPSYCYPDGLIFNTADEDIGYADWLEPTWTDNSLAWIVLEEPGFRPPANLSVGTTILTYSASDYAGNVAHCRIRIQMISSYSAGLSSSTRTVVVAASVGGFVLLVLVSISAVMAIRINRKKNQAAMRFRHLLITISTSIGINDESKIARELKRGQVSLVEVLGKGAFGEVSKGIFTPDSHGTAGYLVAVKVSHANSDEGREDILREAAMMAQFSHPHVVALVGVVTDGDPLLVIMEYCEHGALNRYLQKAKIDAKTRFLLAADCAEGLEYLASLKFVHRDVAARNVLVSSERRAKISDFGMSRETKNSEYYRSAGGQLPVRWTAPEALEGRKFTTQSDVWAFGVLLYEIWTDGDIPYKELTNERVWVAVVGGHRLSCPPHCPQAVHDLMLECWKDVEERPTFASLGTRLRSLYHQVDSSGRLSSPAVPVGAHDYLDFTEKNARPTLALLRTSTSPTSLTDQSTPTTLTDLHPSSHSIGLTDADDFSESTTSWQFVPVDNESLVPLPASALRLPVPLGSLRMASQDEPVELETTGFDDFRANRAGGSELLDELTLV